MDTGTSRPAWFVLTRHWLSLAGVALVTTAGISWLFVLPLNIRGHANPYVGIVFFLILPVVFFTGLALIPIGIYLGKRRIREGLPQTTIDRRTALRRLAWFFGVTTFANILIGTQVTYRAVKHMETPQFCGGTCHIMSPELAAYENSPHSSVECVECHVAPGAVGWLSSKTSGVRQLVHTVLNTAPKPIPSGLATGKLVPSAETCENCHWSQNFSGVRLRVFSKFADDETNTSTETVLVMHAGGNKFSGIHGAHLGPGVHIRYAATDATRQTIPWVEYRNTSTGDAQAFASSDSSPDSVKNLPIYEMQCVDCHNRPTHAFDLPDRAVDNALARGDIPVTLPYVKKESVELLKASYSTRDEAAVKLPGTFVNFYQKTYPGVYAQRPQDVNHAAKAVLAIYNRNVFPDLKVTWGTYPNNLGHTDSPGCFRCHDSSHTSASGKTIAQDCETCHQTLATDEASPEILKTLGIAEWISKARKQ
jgi:NapC/NirT cytochrome c family, N-terminal region